MNITLMKHPDVQDWIEVKRRAFLTVGKETETEPEFSWKKRILYARHSPIRRLPFSVLIEGIPYWVACELRTHVHDMPYVADFNVYIKSSRNDRQAEFDRNAARQDYPVNMIIDMNGEQIMILANKRLCGKATKEAREVVQKICDLVEKSNPEYIGLLVPMCKYHGGVCHEMQPCNMQKAR